MGKTGTGVAKLSIKGESSDANRALLQVEGRFKHLEKQIGDVSRKSKNMSNGAVSMGGKWLSNLGGIAAGYLSVQTAISFTKKALEELNSERQRGADLAKESLPWFAKLAQVSGGDYKKFKALKESALTASKTTGMGLETASDLVFNLESASMLNNKNLSFFSKFNGIIDTPALIKSVGQISNAYRDAGSIENITNKVIAASNVTQTQIPELAAAIPKFAQPAKMVNTSDEESLALASVISRQMAPEEAATRMKALSNVLIKKGMNKDGIVAAVNEIKSKGYKNRRLQRYLGGNIRALEGFQLVADRMDDILDVKKQIEAAEVGTGTSESLSHKVQNVYMHDRNLAAARLATISSQKKNIAEMEVLGGRRNLGEAYLNKKTTESIESGENGAVRFIKGLDRKLAVWFDEMIGLKEHQEDFKKITYLTGFLKSQYDENIDKMINEIEESKNIQKQILELHKQNNIGQHREEN